MKISVFIILFTSTQTNAQKMMSFAEAKIPKPSVTDTSVLHFNQHQQLYKKLSNYDREFYYWVNYSRKNVASFFDSVIVPITKIYPQLKGTNSNSLKSDLQNSKALPLLSLNDTLIRMAITHSKDITDHDLAPSHTSSNGTTFVDRFKQNGLKNCGSENISYGSGDPVFLIALLYLDINIPDLGHRKALLNPTFTNTGIGTSFYRDGNAFVVEDFTCSQ